MNESTRRVKSLVGGKPLHELTPDLLLAILDTLVDISDKLDINKIISSEPIIKKENWTKRK